MPCENGDTAENLRMLSKTVRQSICCTIVCLCIPVSRFAVHIILDIVTYICKYIYIYMLTRELYMLFVFAFLDGVVSTKKEERKPRHGFGHV